MIKFSRHPKERFSDRWQEGIVRTSAGRPQLPRHISSCESLPRCQHKKSNKDRVVKCPFDLPLEATNLAVNILRYQLSDRKSQQKHWHNVRSNIKHRLKVAKIAGNADLVDILQTEFQQLET